MPTKKKSAKARKSHAKKPVAKARARKPAAKTADPAPKSGFMWKLLEMKEARLKAKARPEAAAANPAARAVPQQGSIHGFGRFAGPRRRAA